MGDKSLDIKGSTPQLCSLLVTKRSVSAGLAICKAVQQRIHPSSLHRHMSTVPHLFFLRLCRNDVSRGLVKYQSSSNRQYCTLNHSTHSSPYSKIIMSQNTLRSVAMPDTSCTRSQMSGYAALNTRDGPVGLLFEKI